MRSASSSIYIERRASATAAEGKVQRIQRWRAGGLAGSIYSIYSIYSTYAYTAYKTDTANSNEERSKIYS